MVSDGPDTIVLLHHHHQAGPGAPFVMESSVKVGLIVDIKSTLAGHSCISRILLLANARSGCGTGPSCYGNGKGIGIKGVKAGYEILPLWILPSSKSSAKSLPPPQSVAAQRRNMSKKIVERTDCPKLSEPFIDGLFPIF